MAPTPVSNPDRRFVLTRVDAGVETNVALSSLLPVGFTTDASVRSTVYATTRTAIQSNQDVHYRLYSPSNGGSHTDGDLIWDSTTGGPLI